MAIGTMAAIGLGAAALGGAMSSRSQSKAASKAADTSMQVAQSNNALAQNIYNQNSATLSPYVNRGNVAGNALNDFLGFGQPQQTMPTAQPATAVPYGPQTSGFGGVNALMTSKPWLNVGENPMQAPQMGGGVPQGAVSTQPSARNAFADYIQNSDYAFQFGEGANQLNSGYAGAGTLQSGAAMKALEDYRQNLQSGYRNEWADRVTNQQGAGLSAAGAQAGVGMNYVANVTNNNNAAGTAAANAALVKGQNNPFANALGMAGGFMLGR
jgi:hypothetical protein